MYPTNIISTRIQLLNNELLFYQINIYTQVDVFPKHEYCVNNHYGNN